MTWDRILVVLQEDVGDARAHDEDEAEAQSSENASAGRPMLRHSQWRPALQSIAENAGT